MNISILRLLSVLLLTVALTACGARMGQEIGNRYLKKAIYDAKGGDKVANVTYRAEFATIASIVESECNRAPSWSEFEITCDTGSSESGRYNLTTADGSRMRIDLSEEAQESSAVTLRASIKTRNVKILPGRSSRARSTGAPVPIFGTVLGNIDYGIRKRGIKKVSGGFSDRIRHKMRPSVSSAPPPDQPNHARSAAEAGSAGL